MKCETAGVSQTNFKEYIDPCPICLQADCCESREAVLQHASSPLAVYFSEISQRKTSLWKDEEEKQRKKSALNPSNIDVYRRL